MIRGDSFFSNYTNNVVARGVPFVRPFMFILCARWNHHTTAWGRRDSKISTDNKSPSFVIVADSSRLYTFDMYSVFL